MSARSRARKNRHRHIVPAWDLIVAREAHRRATSNKMEMSIIAFHARGNGRIYTEQALRKILGAGPCMVRGLDGKIMGGVIAHPRKVEKGDAIMGEIEIHPHSEFGKLIKQHPTDFAIRATTDSDKKLKGVVSWDLTDGKPDYIDTHLKRLRDRMGITPEMLVVDPSLLGRKHGEFGGMCAPCGGSHVAVTTPTPIEPFKAYDQPVDSIDMTATQLIETRMKLEKAHRKILNDVEALQDLLDAKRKPFDDFYLDAPITVYEFPERYLDIKPDGEWFPNMEILRQPNELKVPYKSGPYMLAAVAANEYEEFREHLEKIGYAKLRVTRNVAVSTLLGSDQSTETRYFVFIINWLAKASDPYGFSLDTRPAGLSDMMLKHILVHGATYGDK